MRSAAMIAYGVFFMAGAGCGGGAWLFLSPVEFSPDPAPIVEGVCRTNVSFISISDTSLSLSAVTTSAKDASGRVRQESFGAGEFPGSIGSLELPAGGVLQGDLRVDIGGDGLEPPVTVALTAVMTGPGGVAQFSGAFRCDR